MNPAHCGPSLSRNGPMAGSSLLALQLLAILCEADTGDQVAGARSLTRRSAGVHLPRVCVAGRRCGPEGRTAMTRSAWRSAAGRGAGCGRGGEPGEGGGDPVLVGVEVP